MKFELPPLKYAAGDLAPHLSAETLEFHHGKHHLAYVNNLNNLLPGSPFEEATLETMIRKAEGGIFNNAAQVWNHTFYFATLSPSGKRTRQAPWRKPSMPNMVHSKPLGRLYKGCHHPLRFRLGMALHEA
jgi:superoxide dismutase